jgi:glycosyltransferase involved in cell wall biosynthesis
LILLDDGSTDKSGEIAQKFNDPRIVYHRNENNVGLANNLNFGLKMAKGKYIARMDGDDISLPERLQIQIDYLESHPDVDLCSCGLEMFGSENAVWIRDADPEKVKITMMFYSPILHATSVWRKAAFEKHQLFYNQEAFPAEDYDLWARAIFYCRMVNIPQVLYRYRIHGIQVTKMDHRAAERDRSIKLEYLRKALPSLSESNRIEFVDNFLCKKNIAVKSIKTLKILYSKVLDANKQNGFFDEHLLNEQLSKYYQSIVIELLKSNKQEFGSRIKLLSELNLKNNIKFALKRI